MILGIASQVISFLQCIALYDKVHNFNRLPRAIRKKDSKGEKNNIPCFIFFSLLHFLLLVSADADVSEPARI